MNPVDVFIFYLYSCIPDKEMAQLLDDMKELGKCACAPLVEFLCE